MNVLRLSKKGMVISMMSPKKFVLRFGAEISEKPIVYQLVKDFDLIVNIVQANVNPQMQGTMVLEISGERCAEGLEYLGGLGVSVQSLNQGISRDVEKCIMCGECTGVCPTGALYLERPSMEVRFDDNLCVVCQSCIKICPTWAMEASL